ncbi:hypothetical protein GPJ56_000509 [Histomonas meleagridis]|uniref:uncharacterized protein n=1 Tax=Histomonas meleagridis TaxID=135588 RepID=UPI003559A9DF|nr:hypothetical protein GPJ56_000509 [Histomonas meleagridis]KAH0796451.1 hypothetical protein GO595_010344 [Histomonas meleagridis]
MEGFEEVDISIFSRCTEQLHYDEFIFNDNFSSKNAMMSLEVSGKRLDSHFIANGHHSVKDSIESGTKAPTDNLTNEEILGICGKFIDLQASRIDGNDAYTNILTSLYIQKDCEITNPILKFMFKCFSTACYQIEDFVHKLLFSTTFWRHNVKYTTSLVKYDINELSTELEKIEMPEVLKSLARFEISLSNFLNDPYSETLIEDFDIPIETNELGIDKFLHYRDSPPSNAPAKPHIPNHEDAIQMLKRFSSETQEAQKLFKHEFDISTLISTLSNWNESNTHLGLTRYIVYWILFEKPEPTEYFHSIKPELYIRKELRRYYINEKFFKHSTFTDFVNYFNVVIATIVQRLIGPISSAHLYFSDTGASSWSIVQYKGFELQSEAVQQKEFPRCVSKEQQMAAENVFPLWSTHIGSQLLFLTYKWGFMSDVYSLRDIHILTYCMHVITKTSMLSMSQFRVASAVYRTVNNNKSKTWVRNEKDVNRKIQNKTNDEIYLSGLSEFYNGCFNFLKLLSFWKCYEVKNGDFFNEEFVFNNRVLPINKMVHFPKLDYEKFKLEFSIEKYKGYEIIFKKEIQMYFNKAKSEILTYIKENGKSEDASDLLKSILNNLITLSRINENSKVKISYLHKMYPYIQIIQNEEK